MKVKRLRRNFKKFVKLFFEEKVKGAYYVVVGIVSLGSFFYAVYLLTFFSMLIIPAGLMILGSGLVMFGLFCVFSYYWNTATRIVKQENKSTLDILRDSEDTEKVDSGVHSII